MGTYINVDEASASVDGDEGAGKGRQAMTPVARIERAIKKGDKWALQSHRLRNRTDVWWYVEHNGIGIHIAYDPHGTRPILIPWRSLKAALRRERKKEGR